MIKLANKCSAVSTGVGKKIGFHPVTQIECFYLDKFGKCLCHCPGTKYPINSGTKKCAPMET